MGFGGQPSDIVRGECPAPHLLGTGRSDNSALPWAVRIRYPPDAGVCVSGGG